MDKSHRTVDFVFCLDGTLGEEVLKDNVKERLSELVEATSREIGGYGEEGTMRGKFIVFKDLAIDKNPMEVSDWFPLKKGLKDFRSRLDAVDFATREDLPNDGLEALYLAFLSDFRTGPNIRQIIVLVSNKDANMLGEHKDSPNYPKGIWDLENLVLIYFGCTEDPNIKLNVRNELLVEFAPSATLYEELSKVLDIPFYPMHKEKGITEDMEPIAQIIVNGRSTK